MQLRTLNLCQPGNIQFQQHTQLNNIEIESIQIISDGKQLDTSIIISGILLINGSKTISCYGKQCNTNNTSDLAIRAYTVYYLLHQLFITIPAEILSINNITIMIDDRLIAQQLQKLKQKINPNACLLPEHEVIHAIKSLVNQIPQVTIKYQKSTVIHNDMTDIEPIDECKLLLKQASTLQTQQIPVPKIHTQQTELIINNKLISTKY
jgi:hypothetical protein